MFYPKPLALKEILNDLALSNDADLIRLQGT